MDNVPVRMAIVGVRHMEAAKTGFQIYLGHGFWRIWAVFWGDVLDSIFIYRRTICHVYLVGGRHPMGYRPRRGEFRGDGGAVYANKKSHS